MRKALLIGINDYSFSPLASCISDANRMFNILSKNFDNSPNFHCKKLVSNEDFVSKESLTEAVIDLFSTDSDVALLYFSGHGSEQTKTSEACLVTQDAKQHSEGMTLDFLLKQLSQSKAKENIIILDCCFSGSAGEFSFVNNASIICEGTSIITSSHKSQVSFEDHEGGFFTSIIYNALNGGAADTTGLVTVASIYAFADKLLGPWDQRPTFKCNITKMVPLRYCKPQIELDTLRKLPVYFSKPDFEYQLDPSFEPEAEPKGHGNEIIFADLQKYNRTGLLVPIGEEHMFFAAINSKYCILTPLGKYYWKLAKECKI